MVTNKLYNALEFDKILDLTSQFLQFEESAKFLQKLVPERNPEKINENLNLTYQCMSAEYLDRLSLKSIRNIRKSIPVLQLEGSQLDVPELLNITNIVTNSNQLYNILNERKSVLETELKLLLAQFHEFKELVRTFEKIFDKDHKIRNNATNELFQIRASIVQLSSVIYKQFKRELEICKKQGWLAEGEESVYNGRYVLRIQAEHKRKLKGLIAGESDSGKTIFMEPQACVELHNEMFELELEEGREIQKILRQLTGACRLVLSDILEDYDRQITFDILLAKAKLSKQYKGVKPLLSTERNIVIINGIHPLLFMHLQESKQPAVPLNLRLDPKNRILIISGPNAGGKTIVLKTIGLFQLMLRAGYLVPLNPSSEIAIFQNIMVDIGDNQSLENDLSTYSAKLAFMRKLVMKADQETLVLIDEFGSGTEPVIGGSIAEVVLEELVKRKSFGVITTHYSNLKGLAHNKSGLLNGSMTFDVEQKRPKFELVQGIPGSSYALEMAERLKFPEYIISRARKKAHRGVVNLESLISTLKNDKQELEAKNQTLEFKIQSLSKLIKAYEQMQRQNDLKRLKLKLDSKQQEFESLTDQSDKTKVLIKEIETKLNLVAARKLAEETEMRLKQSTAELKEIHLNYQQALRSQHPVSEIKTGDQVLILKNNITGTVAHIYHNQVEVITEKFTIFVDVGDVVPVKKTNDLTLKSKLDLDIVQRASSVKGLLDIRGTSPDDAARAFEEYLDLAIVSNLKEARILHGKGSGILRKTILQAIKKSKFIKKYRHPEEQDGGLGVTIIEFT